MTENFYRDIAAFQQVGGTVCVEHEALDLNTWVLNQLEARRGNNVLNIGTGGGIQALSLARTVNDEGYILAIDHSYAALNVLSQRSQKNGLERRIRFLYINLDDLPGHLRPEDFDRALGGRALYRTRQPQAAFQAIHEALRPGGVFFFYGPSRKDLTELRLFQADLYDEESSQENWELLFIEKVGLPYARDLFEQIEIMKFENPLRFDSPEGLYNCWRTSDLHEKTLERDFQQAALYHFQSHRVFETTQRLIGVRAIK